MSNIEVGNQVISHHQFIELPMGHPQGCRDAKVVTTNEDISTKEEGVRVLAEKGEVGKVVQTEPSKNPLHFLPVVHFMESKSTITVQPHEISIVNQQEKEKENGAIEGEDQTIFMDYADFDEKMAELETEFEQFTSDLRVGGDLLDYTKPGHGRKYLSDVTQIAWVTFLSARLGLGPERIYEIERAVYSIGTDRTYPYTDEVEEGTFHTDQ